jgi:hypothetical protein
VPFLRSLVRLFSVKQADEFAMSAADTLLEALDEMDETSPVRPVVIYDPLFATTWSIDPLGPSAFAIRNYLAQIKHVDPMSYEDFVSRNPSQGLKIIALR